jgi:hypothetical protein
MRMRTPDVVALVPGFLGFARFGGFYYFADRLIAVIRGVMEEALGRPVPVVPVTTLPTDGLADRQEDLLDNLAELCERLPDVERIHLIGHSTGGVDVQLLGCTTSFGGEAWDPDTEPIRDRLRSVVTISAPHFGTSLADSRLARWGENPILHPTALLPELHTLVNLALLVPRDLAAVAGLGLAAPNDVLKFMWQVAQNRELIAALRPEAMEEVRARLTHDPRIPLTCFVTGTVPQDDGERPSDPFFRDLAQLTRGPESVAAEVERAGRLLRDLLEARPDLVIRHDDAQMPDLVPGLNDGVVNSLRQLVHPDRPDEVGGLVVADHADVLGHYDRQDGLVEGREYNAGLFHSGAGFADDEFFALYRRVARAILRTIPGARDDEEAGFDVVSIQPA